MFCKNFLYFFSLLIFYKHSVCKYVNDLMLSGEDAACDLLSNTKNPITHI